MKVLAVCGAHNKKRNTATMLEQAFEGCMSVDGTEGELVNLFDLDFKGCRGCHQCKRIEEKWRGHCAQKDGLSPLLEKAIDADVLLVGSPIYFGNLSGAARCFLERYLFPSMTYEKEKVLQYPKHTKIGWVLTMNAPEQVNQPFIDWLCMVCERMVGETRSVSAYQTQQFDDYSKYAASMFDVEKVKARHLEQFPKDCEAAFAMGRQLAESVLAG